MLLLLLLVLMGVLPWGSNVVLGFPVGTLQPQVPQVSIVVRVRKKRDQFWDVWQLNSNVCPPSLCRPVSQPSKEKPETGQSTPTSFRSRGTGGSMFYQGDITLDEEVDRFIFPERYELSSGPARAKRATVRLRNRMWKNGEVPYEFSKEFSGQAKRAVHRAFKHITQRSCITFRQRNESDVDYVQFISDPGCWSAIGRTGGKQVLSLGRGCETIGTAVHEIFHSLGVWHEQARKDRDEFVTIIEENVSERFLKDFDKISEDVSTSRGFPYDYGSVMHYSRYAFTRNGKPTIKVTGIGQDLGLALRQRQGLSTIDMAQLRDMYRCNAYSHSLHATCHEGWFKQETSCYKFFPRPKLPFAAASRKCKELNSHLVFVETLREDKFLASHLWKEYPSLHIWRTGGRVVNGTMKWYREDSNPVPLPHTNWGQGQPSTGRTLVLRRDRRTNETHWAGVGFGSLKPQRQKVFPFICERRARRKCLKLNHPDGRDYRGKLDHTVDGLTCQRWSEHYPHPHNLTDPSKANDLNDDEDLDSVAQDRLDGLGNHNFCRNPRGLRRGRPWCFTTKRQPEWQLCDVSVCSPSS